MTQRSSHRPSPQQAGASLAPTGTLRVAINFGNVVLAQRGPDGDARGVTVELAHEMARQLGLPLELVRFDAAGKVFDALERGAWDVAFMAIDPKRAAQMSFTAPYVFIEGTYLVCGDAPFTRCAELDAADTRVGISRGSAYDLFLQRSLQHARLLHADSPQAAYELFAAGEVDALAAVRQPLLQYAASQPGLRVLDDAFMRIDQAIGVPKDREAGHLWLEGFIDQAKAVGLVAAALQRSGQGSATVAP